MRRENHIRICQQRDPFEDQERSEGDDDDVQNDENDDNDENERTSLSEGTRSRDVRRVLEQRMCDRGSGLGPRIEDLDRRPSLVRSRTSCGYGRFYNYSYASCELTPRGF